MFPIPGMMVTIKYFSNVKYSFFFLAASVGFLAACSGLEKDIQVDAADDVEISKVIFNVLPVIDDDAVETRASADPLSNYNITFAWEDTDRIGIFPNKGSQIYFEPEDGVGTSSASFDGGGWALKPNSSYVSYYPFVADFDLDRNAIPISFANQKQTGTEGPFNGEKWVLATNSTTSQNGILTFEYSILNTIINVIATLPAGTYTSASLNIYEPLFAEEATFSLDEKTITGSTFSNKMEIELEDFTLASDSTVPIYFMAAPVDLTGKEITVIITKDDGSRYKCTKTPSGAYNAGRRRGLTCEMQKDANIINFADPTVKELCVANWDTDRDGELDLDEAAVVTNIGGVFMSNKDIREFNELQYFTGLKAIPEMAFSESSIESLVIPSSVLGIWAGAFSGCSSLTSITIPDSVSSIENGAFYQCSSLTSITIPDSVEIIRAGAFSESGLTSITIPDSVSSIENGAFSKCSSLTSITIPSSVSFIGDEAFSECSSLTSAILGEGLASTGNGVFSGCSSLISITIPDSVKSIGNGAFYQCSSLTSITIPDSVVIIGTMAFSECSSLTSAILGEGLGLIADQAFSGCSSLTSITIYATTPPLPPYALKGEDLTDYEDFAIYVPAGSVDAYKQSWTSYAQWIYPMQEGTVPGAGDDGND